MTERPVPLWCTEGMYQLQKEDLSVGGGWAEGLRRQYGVTPNIFKLNVIRCCIVYLYGLRQPMHLI